MNNINTMNSKQCSKCNIDKPLTMFHNLKSGRYGKHSNCKECRINYRKQLCYTKPKKGTLKCSQCHIIKFVDNFYADKSKSTGLQSCCSLCQKEKIYESNSKLSTFIEKLIKKINKIELTSQDLIDLYLKQKKQCAITNELLTYYDGPILTTNNYEKKFNINIIKLDETKGYSKNNLIIVGDIIHKMKKNLTIEEFKHICSLVSNKL